MDTFRPNKMSRAAYMNRVMKAQQPKVGIGQLVRDGSGTGADLLRHSVQLIGVLGLVGLAVGATTECRAYHEVLNWISSLFV